MVKALFSDMGQGRAPLIFPKEGMSLFSSKATLPRKTCPIASCLNHRLLKITQLNKGKMWSPGLASLDLRPCIPRPGAVPEPLPRPGFTVPHWKMEQAGEQRVGLEPVELLQGPSQNLAGQVLRQSWQRSWAGLGWNLQAGSKQSPPQLMLRKACGKGEPSEELCGLLWPSPTVCFGAAFQIWPVIHQFRPATWQDSCLHQREMLWAQPRAADSTLIIQGRRSRWPSHSKGLV